MISLILSGLLLLACGAFVAALFVWVRFVQPERQRNAEALTREAASQKREASLRSALASVAAEQVRIRGAGKSYHESRATIRA